MIDLHTHVLPGIDDGAETMEEALALCRMASAEGVSVIVATPHMFCDVGNPLGEEIAAATDRLRNELADNGIDIELRHAAEVAMVEGLAERIEAGEVPMLDTEGRFVLLEAPRAGDCSTEISEMVFQLQLRGISPVIAHPECIESFYCDHELADKLVRQGAFLQITASSLLCGGDRHDMAMDFLENGLIHVAASDAHDAQHRPARLAAARDAFAEMAGLENAEKLFNTNPGRILDGIAPESLPPFQKPKREHTGIMGAFRRMLTAKESVS
jgi:protein-tyrosine phosphatase